MSVRDLDRETIERAIEEWSLEDQITLAQSILQRALLQRRQQPQRPSWRAMVGLASDGQEPPTDGQVAQWLDEHRMKKYGE